MLARRFGSPTRQLANDSEMFNAFKVWQGATKGILRTSGLKEPPFGNVVLLAWPSADDEDNATETDAKDDPLN